MVKPFDIAGKSIGPGAPCFIIAEAGVNHNGDIILARKLIDAAVESCADAVKFQTFNADRIITRDAPQADYQRRNIGVEESQYAMLKRLEMSHAMHRELLDYCTHRSIFFLSTPFEEESADFLNSLHIPAFKIPSGEITNLPFLDHVARMLQPMIVSTGMSTLDDVSAAVACIRATGNERLALLHCVSNYPAAASDINLRAMDTLRETFAVPTGYSDHTDGLEIAFAAVARGAQIIEKHFTLDRALPGPDHKASLEPAELTALVTGIRRIETSLGDGIKRCVDAEKSTAAVARKSIVANRDVAAGSILAREDLVIQRPGTGISPARLNAIIGRKTRVALRAGDVLTNVALA
jgi:N,N'-diacetyllegionaminate synthase